MAVDVTKSLIPIYADSYTAVTADETGDTHVFVFPNPVKNAIVQVRAKAGTLNETGLDVDIAGGKVTVKVTALAADDVISILAW